MGKNNKVTIKSFFFIRKCISRIYSSVEYCIEML